jgi:hypothetical protein
MTPMPTVTIQLILMILALVLFILAAIGIPSRVNLLAAGLALWLLATMIRSS